MTRTSPARRRFIMTAFLAAAALAMASGARAAPSLTQETGNRLINASPQSITGTYTTPLRLYFLRDFQVLSATSSDGLAWTEETGVRVSSESFNGSVVAFSSVTSAAVLPLDAAGFRMILAVVSSTGDYRVISASSSDGLNWGLEGTKFSLATGTYAGSTRLVEESDGSWRLFYVQPFSTGLSSTTFRVFTSTSGDEGVTWGPATQAFSQQAQAVTPSVLTDGRLRIFYTAPLANSTTATQILSAIQVVGAGTINFNQEPGVRLSTGADSGALGSLLAFRDVESFRWRVYEEFLASTTASVPIVASALTDQPDPQRIAPGSVTRTTPASAFSISGEIFSSTVTARLTKTGESDIVGTSVSRSDDETLSAVFDTVGAALGRWDLVVQNSDGQTGTLASALEVTFAAGSVTHLDNVFHPLQGQKAHFDVTLFNDGKLTIKLYTIDGRILRTLFDGDAVSGTTGFDWDARTDNGNLVASGVYLISFKGPRLDSREKLVVIK